MVGNVILPNFWKIVTGVTFIVGACSIMGLVGYFGVRPAVKKAYGVAKPFSDKICVVLYRKKL